MYKIKKTKTPYICSINAIFVYNVLDYLLLNIHLDQGERHSFLITSSLILVLFVTICIAFIHKGISSWILECNCTRKRFLTIFLTTIFHFVLWLLFIFLSFFPPTKHKTCIYFSNGICKLHRHWEIMAVETNDKGYEMVTQ